MALLSHALDHRATEDLKGRALLMLDLAGCRAANDEPEEAAHLVSQAVDDAGPAMIQPIITRALSARTALERWANLRSVHEMNEKIEELVNGR